jgi:transcriptional regulator with XRE-family HTH domain
MPKNAASEDLRDRLAVNVRVRRERQGLTQLELAVEAGVTAGTIYWLERNGRGSVGTVDAVATALGTTASKLLA